MTVLASIPSPTQAVWHLGPLPIRAYALCIIAGIILCVWISDRRWQARGGAPGEVLDISVWAVPFGIVGGRLYHVITTPEPYWGKGGDPLRAFAIWDGGLGIWGAIALGALGAWIGCRRKGIPLPSFADTIAPGLLVAEAVGRVGNYFNNEIYGRRTGLPWGLQVHEWDASTGEAVRDAAGHPVLLPGAYHPTFLYEALWCLFVALAVVLLDRRFHLDRGRSFAVYVMMYTAGRLFIESLRSDTANMILGHRLNEWTSVLVFLGGLTLFVVQTIKVRRASHNTDAIPERQDV